MKKQKITKELVGKLRDKMLREGEEPSVDTIYSILSHLGSKEQVSRYYNELDTDSRKTGNSQYSLDDRYE